jgi:hypothetical protein
MMLKRLRTTLQRRQRRRHITRIQRSLASLGYTYQDLEEMACLSASLGLGIDEERESCEDRRVKLPTLCEVLEAWPR